MIVYHGSSVVVEHPDIRHSYRALDFGQGFYVTTVEEQARIWARRKAVYFGNERGILNRYRMAENVSGLNVKCFAPDLIEWLDFVCACRDGQLIYQDYDLIWGKVANDKVFRVIEKYKAGEWSREQALKEIRVYPGYDQAALISQRAIDQLLIFDGYREV